MQSDLFDSVEADRLKEEGMTRAAENRAELLDSAKSIAKLIATQDGTVTVDDVYSLMLRTCFSPHLLGNGWGSLFKGKSWEFTGEWRKSTRVTNHGRMVRVWRLRA